MRIKGVNAQIQRFARAPRKARRRCAQIADHLAHDTALSAFVAEVVCASGATLPRTVTSPPPNGGNCSNRGATRRRHAGRMLLMLQNPHRQPNIHPGTEGGGPEATGALRDTSLATTPAGGDPTTSRHISHVISLRSLFETARKRCNSNDVDSTFELIAGELRATLMGGSRAWPSLETTRRSKAPHDAKPPPNRGTCAVRGARLSLAHVEGASKRGELHQ